MSAENSLVPVVVIPPSDPVEQINSLHQEVKDYCVQSGEAMTKAVHAAWKAGGLLLIEKQAVQKRIGPGSWLLWLQKNFRGTERTAQRYMALAKNVTRVSDLQGLSLRQVYILLGIATETKKPSTQKLSPLPAQLVLVNRFLRWANTQGQLHKLSESQKAALRRDFKPIQNWIGELYSSGSPSLVDADVKVLAGR